MAIKDIFNKGKKKVFNHKGIDSFAEVKSAAKEVNTYEVAHSYRSDLGKKLCYMIALPELGLDFANISQFGWEPLEAYFTTDELEEMYKYCLYTFLKKRQKFPPFEKEAEFYKIIKQYGWVIALPNTATVAREKKDIPGSAENSEKWIWRIRRALSTRVLCNYPSKGSIAWANALYGGDIDNCRVLVNDVIDSDFLLKNVNDLSLRQQLYSEEVKYYEDVLSRMEIHLEKAIGDKKHQEYIVKDLLNKRMKEFAIDTIKFKKREQSQNRD